GIQAAPAAIQEDEALPQALERIKKTMIEKALEACEGNRTRAAEKLGISRPNLQKTMKRLGVG
ncbi:MAG: sigma-54-dependent Fis family transcriptional regulator, partial [Gemmatimonadetes bacterium]|nr:sigma-54-dependent Fis family transcriptional regulator [Gemmatimonadota bacterium]